MHSKESSMISRILYLLAFAICLAGPAAKSRAEEVHAGATAAAATAAHEGTHEKAELMPNMGLPASWFSALWVIIIFCVMLAILYPTAWKNVIAGLKAREERIRGDIAAAESARTKAEATLREYTAQLATAEQRARDTINAAAADAERIATQ